VGTELLRRRVLGLRSSTMARRASRHPGCSRGCRRRSERAAERRIAADAMGVEWRRRIDKGGEKGGTAAQVQLT